ncbi:LysR family transcriptional regulator [Amycolatopsis minnesotensis]|uniref:LysR family transcriptional regulator n=1 Tax=Amycolatopsis minnesotensis TaxID=337894 RepID=A0ABN2SFX6_9PSEU
MTGIELRQLRYFAAVAESGTVTEAARRLRIAQPSLSQQIAELERRLGVPLFHRSAHGMALTTAGETFLAGVQRVLAELTTVIETARKTPPRRKVGVCAGLTPTVLADIESALGADTVLESVDTVRQTAQLRSGDLDFGLLRLPANTDGLFVAEVSDEPLGVVVADADELAPKETVDWAAVRHRELLWFRDSRAPGFADAVLGHLAAHSWRPNTYRPRSTSHTVFVHALRTRPNLVALRPRETVPAGFQWLPFREDPPRERIGLATAHRMSDLLAGARDRGWRVTFDALP